MSRLFQLGDHRSLLAPLNDARYDDPAQVDSAWDDQQGDVSQGLAGAALSFEAIRDTPFKTLCFRNNQDDELHMRFQMPHGWNRGEVRPHIHLAPLADPAVAQIAHFAGQYAWVRSSIPLNAAWTPFTSDLTVNPGDVNAHKVIRLGAIGSVVPPADAIESMLLLIYVKRFATDPADTYKTAKGYGTAAANLGVLSVDVHIQPEKLGTADEIASQG